MNEFAVVSEGVTDYSKGYRKRSELRAKGTLNPSLSIFLEELDRRKIRLPAP